MKRDRCYKLVNEEKLKIAKCSICDIAVTEETTRCFDFDHIDMNTKTDTISNLCSKCSIKKIKEEIDKCRLLCCNCHRLHTIKQLGSVDYNAYNHDSELESIDRKYIPRKAVLNIIGSEYVSKPVLKIVTK